MLFDSVPFCGLQSEKDLELNKVDACFFVHAVQFGIILVCGLVYTVFISACQGRSSGGASGAAAPGSRVKGAAK